MTFTEDWRSPAFTMTKSEFFARPDDYVADNQFHQVTMTILGSRWAAKRDGLYVTYSPLFTAPIFGSAHSHLAISTSDNDSLLLVKRMAYWAKSKHVTFSQIVDRTSYELITSDQWIGDLRGAFIVVHFKDDSDGGEGNLLRDIYEMVADLTGPRIDPTESTCAPQVCQLERDVSEDGQPHFYALSLQDCRGPVRAERASRSVTYSLRPKDDLRRLRSCSSLGRPRAIKDGTYLLSGILAVRHSGPIYLGLTPSGNRVRIKEAHEHTFIAPGLKATTALETEARISRQYKGSIQTIPRLIEVHSEGARRFYIYSHDESVSLAELISQYSPMVNGWHPDVIRYYRERLSSVMSGLEQAYDELHSIGIILGDIALEDVATTPDGGIVFRSLELSYEPGKDEPKPRIGMWSRHISPTEYDERGGFARDQQCLASLLVSLMLPIVPLLLLDCQRLDDILVWLVRQYNLPAPVSSQLSRLVKAGFSKADLLTPNTRTGTLQTGSQEAESLSPDEQGWVPTLIERATSFILSHVYGTQKDMSFPADPFVFRGHQVSFAHGVAGLVFALNCVGMDIPEGMICRLRDELAERARLPGLFYGKVGVAIALMDSGYLDDAHELLAQADADPRLSCSPGLFCGVAGFGIAALRLFLLTGRQIHIDMAIKAGNILKRSSTAEPTGRTWRTDTGVAFGLGHGASGIALFLAYLSQAAADLSFLSLAIEAMQFEVSHAYVTPIPSTTWPEYRSLSTDRVLPYLEFGSAGVGTALLRLWAITQDRWFYDALLLAAADCDSIAPFPGYSMGLAGFGHLFLDVNSLTGDHTFYLRATRVADAIRHFSLERSSGIAFPGNGLSKLSCDFATGSCGIIVFLSRLLRRGRSPLMVDELLPRSALYQTPLGALKAS